MQKLREMGYSELDLTPYDRDGFNWYDWHRLIEPPKPLTERSKPTSQKVDSFRELTCRIYPIVWKKIRDEVIYLIEDSMAKRRRAHSRMRTQGHTARGIGA